jgi:hypothetical protein
MWYLFDITVCTLLFGQPASVNAITSNTAEHAREIWFAPFTQMTA